MPLHCNGVNSVSCFKSNSVVDGLQKRIIIANFEENFKTETIGFKGFSRLPAVLVQRCDATYLNSIKLNSKKKKKPTQNENITRKNSTNSAKILKCSVNLVKADLEKLKAALLKKSRGCDNAVKQGHVIPIADSAKNISCVSDTPPLKNGKISPDFPAVHSEKNVFQKLNTISVNNNNKNVSKNFNTLSVNNNINISKNFNTTSVDIDKIVSQILGTPPISRNKTSSPILKKPTVYKKKSKSRKPGILPVRNNKTKSRNLGGKLLLDNENESQNLDIPIVLNRLKNLNLKNVDLPAVQSDVSASGNAQAAAHNTTINTENSNSPVLTNISQNLNTLVEHNNEKISNKLDAPVVLQVKNANTRAVHSDRHTKNLDITEPNDTKITVIANSPVSNDVNIQKNFNTPAYISSFQDLDTKEHKYANVIENFIAPRQNDTDVPKTLIKSVLDDINIVKTCDKPDKNITKRVNSPLVYKGVKIVLNSDTEIPNFDVHVPLVRIDEKPKKSSSKKERKREKKKRRHSHCPHKIKCKKHKTIFHYSDTPIIDSNGNISNFETAIDSGINPFETAINSVLNSSKVYVSSLVNSDTSNSDSSILDSYLDIYQDYPSVINSSPHTHTCIVYSYTNSVQDNETQVTESDLNNSEECNLSIKNSDENISQVSGIPILDANLKTIDVPNSCQDSVTLTDESAVNISQGDKTLVDTDMTISLNSVTPIEDSNLISTDIVETSQDLYTSNVKSINISEGCDSDINISLNSVTPIESDLNTADILETSQDFDTSIVKSPGNISQGSNTTLADSDLNISLNSVTSIVDSDLTPYLRDSDTTIVCSDLNISQYSSNTAIVGSDVNLSPYSDSSSYVDSEINISQYSHTPIACPDIMINFPQYADTSMLEPDINFAQDAEGLMDSVMNIAQYAETATAEFNLNISQKPNTPLVDNYTSDSYDSDILMICASMNKVNLKCKICEKVYSNEKKLQNHKENKHMLVYKSKSNKPKKRVSFSDKVIIHEVSEYHKCRKCLKIFENYRSLKVHKKLKHKKRKCYICDYCSKSFVDRVFFKVHIKLHCDVCGKLLPNKKKYLNHRKKVCRVLKLYKCKKCRGRFFKSMDLRDHYFEHTSSCCVCDICKDQFKTKCGVAHHISFLHCNNRSSSLYSMHHLGTERLYLCSFCDESSVDREFIEKHVRLLPDLNNRAMKGYKDYYFCDQCLKKFKTESDMLHHKWTHFLKTSDNSQVRPKSILVNKRKEIRTMYNIHEKLPGYLQPKVVLEKLKIAEKVPAKIVPEKDFVKPVVKSEVNNGNTKRPAVHPKQKKTIISKHQCQNCGRYFSSNYNLNRHIENLHGDYENLQCRVCEETFVWPSLLRSHKCVRLNQPEMPFRDARPEIRFDNLHEITPSFDDLNLNESDDYLNSLDFDIPSPDVGNDLNAVVPTSPQLKESRYVPLHSLGYRVVMQEVPIEF